MHHGIARRKALAFFRSRGVTTSYAADDFHRSIVVVKPAVFLITWNGNRICAVLSRLDALARVWE